MTLILSDDRLFVLNLRPNVHEDCRFCKRQTSPKIDTEQIIRAFGHLLWTGTGVCFFTL